MKIASKSPGKKKGKDNGPAALLDDNGLIKSWCSDSPDGKLLKTLVFNGNLDNMTPAKVRDSQPSFSRYTYGCFSSALAGVRKSYNTQARNRATKGKDKSFKGLVAHDTIDEDDDEDDDDFDVDGMSRLSLDDEFSYDTQTVGYKSTAAPRRTPPRHPRRSSAKTVVVGRPISDSQSVVSLTSSSALSSKGSCISSMTGIQVALDTWRDEKGFRRCSGQMLAPSYLEEPQFRISTDQRHLVVWLPFSKDLTDPDRAFAHIRRKHPDIQDYHPLIIARQETLAVATGRNPNNHIDDDEGRLYLPFKVRYEWVTHAHDHIFYGIEPVEHDSGECWWHIHMIEDVKDSYAVHAAHKEGTNKTPPRFVGGNVGRDGDDVDDMSVASMRSTRSVKSLASVRSARSKKTQYTEETYRSNHKDDNASQYSGTGAVRSDVKRVKRTPSRQDYAVDDRKLPAREEVVVETVTEDDHRDVRTVA